MISLQILVPALLLFNALPLWLMLLIRLKLAHKSVKTVFLTLVLFGMFWGDAVILCRYDGLDAAVRTQIINFSFFSAVIFANLFLAFCIEFSERKYLFKKPFFWMVCAHTLILAFCCFTDLVVVSFEATPEKMRFIYGAIYPWYAAAIIVMQLSGILLLIQTFRKTGNEILKFQLGVVIRYALITFCAVVVSNLAIPVLLQTSRYSFNGPFLALFFLLGVFRILFRGAQLYVLETLNRYLRSAPFHIQENVLAMREALQVLKAAILSPGEKSLRQLQFAGLSGDAVNISIGKNFHSDLPVLEELVLQKEIFPQKWYSGFYDTLRLLESDNRHLALALLKAESVVREKWLTDVINDLPVRSALIPESSYDIKNHLAEIQKNLQDNLETYGVAMCTMSRLMFRQVSIAAEHSRGNQLMIFEGESGTGKATLAEAMNFYRLKTKSLIEISCQSANIDALTKRIEAVANEATRSKMKVGILIRNIDFLPLEMLSIFNPVFSLPQDKVFIYITSAPDYLRNLEDVSGILFHKLNQVRVEVPPLRRRGDDLKYLIFHYAALYAGKLQIPYTHISRKFIEQAMALSWQGNIVELQNALQREILNNLPPVLGTLHLNDPVALAAPGEILTPLERAERKVILDYLRKNNFNKNRTRIELDITVNTLNAKILKYGIELPV